MTKNILFVGITVVVALIASWLTGQYTHPDDMALARLVENRTLICFFFTMWLYRSTQKGN